jgi:hypothetical protein
MKLKLDCFSCHYAVIDSDTEVGIFDYLDACSCYEVAEWVEEKLSNMDEFHYENVELAFPRKCGHFLSVQLTCSHISDGHGTCLYCSKEVTNDK